MQAEKTGPGKWLFFIAIGRISQLT
jgi:hypothetical protein